jgi:hypothetical protein
MSFQPIKRKRGRPKKVNFDFSIQQPHSQKLGGLNMEVTQLPTNVEIEDWEQEIDDNGINGVNGVNRELREIKTNIVEPNANNEPEQGISGNSFVPVDKKNLFQQPTIIHIIDGEKGGCGKSFVCKTFIEYCKSIAYNMVIEVIVYD